MQVSLEKFIFGTLITAALLPINVSAAPVNTLGKLPWQGGISAKVSQTLHTDGLGKSAFDIALPAGTPVLAPVDSTVVWSCIAKGTTDHHAIMLQQANSDRKYTLFHVQGNSSNIYKNRNFRAGEQIGVVAADMPKDRNCAVSYGVHLHFGLPTQNEVVDGVSFTKTSPALNTVLTSSNGTATSPQPPQATTFQSPVSKLSVSVPSVDLTIQAKKVSGQKVYWRMYRTAVGNLPARYWQGEQVASSNSLTLPDLDGSGDTLKGVNYYTVASLSPIPKEDVAKMRTSCFASTGGTQLCDRASR
ncbi:peptidoglycan DD-metalloendopeptidase family protein [Plectonema cf. radiosum LEGE 06105]|uniref:Peptidoglycan DD-metalloendopeptidase family protein n=1 Tax=Plectonema cf. radiosum LEGE 06105 TaxID=945769 RepID=A0A8J7F2Z8_9CYAN|nr:M23 family metallopeptidase [Plectonema radiosum]MBE9214007.1 peptidoglycan DD-metalloendopeptidase family protein [Plectonema cf. radiosum LEGE 06105]